MGYKLKVKKVFLSLLLLGSFLTIPAVVAEVSDVVRVGITDNKFQNVLRQDVVLYAIDDATICDKQTRKPLINVEANTDIIVKNSVAGLNVVVKDQTATLRDFVLFSETGLMGIRGLQRKGKDALYHFSQ